MAPEGVVDFSRRAKHRNMTVLRRLVETLRVDTLPSLDAGHPPGVLLLSLRKPRSARMAVFESSVPLAVSREQLWEFLVRPVNVLRILPADAGMSFLQAPDRLELGSRVEFQLEGMGPVQRILHEVTHFEPQMRFVESQVKGPLKSWNHDHRLEEHADGVLLVDRVEFEPPGGLIGFLVTEERVYGMLESGFAHRHAALRELCAQGTL